MNCTTPRCENAAIRGQVCKKCYKKIYYDKTFRSLPRKQARGARGGVWTRCWRKDCRKRFKAGAWQHPKYSLCPSCKVKAAEIGVGLEWVERQTSLRGIR